MVQSPVEANLCIDSAFFQKTLDSLCAHVAVLTEDGTIVAVNAPWNRFASNNGLAHEVSVVRVQIISALAIGRLDHVRKKPQSCRQAFAM